MTSLPIKLVVRAIMNFSEVMDMALLKIYLRSLHIYTYHILNIDTYHSNISIPIIFTTLIHIKAIFCKQKKIFKCFLTSTRYPFMAKYVLY